MNLPVYRPLIFFFLLIFLRLSVGAKEFPIVTAKEKATIVYSSKAPLLDSISAHLLADDIERVTRYRPDVTTDIANAKGFVIIIGAATSPMLRKISGTAMLQKNLQGKWECFGLSVVDKPRNGIKKALVIAGSDERGTAYGVFSVSEKIGVSPWYWWADVATKKRKDLILAQADFISTSPSVKYRGIFINDEDWGLRPWAANIFEPGKKTSVRGHMQKCLNSCSV